SLSGFARGSLAGRPVRRRPGPAQGNEGGASGGLLSRSRRMARRGGGAIPCESVAGHLWLGGIESLSWWVFKGPDGPTPFASMAPPGAVQKILAGGFFWLYSLSLN